MELNQELKEIVRPDKTALLIWDVQNMLVRNIFNTEIFLSNAKSVISSARENDVPVMFSKITPLPEKFESPVRKYLRKNSSMRMQPAENAYDLAITPLESEIVIPKNTASIFIGTNFEQLLRNSGITTIAFIGIATEMGIESSARDASNRGFFPIIITDAVSSFNQEAHNRSLENLKSMMILASSREIISFWKKS